LSLPVLSRLHLSFLPCLDLTPLYLSCPPLK
jgi:hypothetical protein